MDRARVSGHPWRGGRERAEQSRSAAGRARREDAEDARCARSCSAGWAGRGAGSRRARMGCACRRARCIRRGRGGSGRAGWRRGGAQGKTSGGRGGAVGVRTATPAQPCFARVLSDGELGGWITRLQRIGGPLSPSQALPLSETLHGVESSRGSSADPPAPLLPLHRHPLEEQKDKAYAGSSAGIQPPIRSRGYNAYP